MIVETILNVLVSLLLGIIGLFPAIPAVRLEFLDGVVRVLSLADTFLSLHVVSTCFLVVFVLQNAHVIWGVIMWVVRKIPGVK